MSMRGWGRAWDVLYWSGAGVALLTGLVLPPRSGVVLLGLAGFMLVLAPFRGRPTVFWPVLSAYLGFAVGFTVVGLVAEQPVLPGLLIGTAAAAVAAGLAAVITRKQRDLAERDRDGRS